MDNFKIDTKNFFNSTASTSTTNTSKHSDVKSTFAALLAEKKSNIKQDLEDMQQLRAEIKLNQSLHKMLTGNEVNEPIEDSNVSDLSSLSNMLNQSSSAEELETIKHFLPDGSVLILNMQGNTIVSQNKIKAGDTVSQLFT